MESPSRTSSSCQHHARGLVVAVDVIHQVITGQSPAAGNYRPVIKAEQVFLILSLFLLIW